MNDEKNQPNRNNIPEDENRFAPPLEDDADLLPDLAAEMEALAGELDGLDLDVPVITEPSIEKNQIIDQIHESEEISDQTDDAIQNEDFEFQENFINPEKVDSALGSFDDLEGIVETHEKEEQKRQEDIERIHTVLDNPMPRPEPLTLRRGNIVSLLPGLVLIGIGAWLTFAYTTESAAPTPSTVISILIALFALMLIMSWLASGRWYRGALFLSLWGILSAAAVVYTLNTFDPTLIPAMLLIAFGGAFFLSGIFARPLSMLIVLPGLMFMVAGGTLFALNQGYIPTMITTTLATGWIAVAAIVGLIIILPVLRRIWTR